MEHRPELPFLITLSVAIAVMLPAQTKNISFKLLNIEYWKSSHTLRQKDKRFI